MVLVRKNLAQKRIIKSNAAALPWKTSIHSGVFGISRIKKECAKKAPNIKAANDNLLINIYFPGLYGIGFFSFRCLPPPAPVANNSMMLPFVGW
jgi:hypothetical protein